MMLKLKAIPKLILLCAMILAVASLLSTPETGGVKKANQGLSPLIEEIKFTGNSVRGAPSSEVLLSPSAKTAALEDWKILYGRPPRRADPLEYQPEYVTAHLGELLARVERNDGQAAFAVFSLALSCGQVNTWGRLAPGAGFEKKGCRELASHQLPLRELLGLAAKNGSVEGIPALLGMIDGMRRNGSDQSEIQRLSEIAILALQSSAEHGNRDAVGMLGVVFSQGGLTNQDLVKATAYLEIFEQATDSPATRSQQLRRSLRSYDLNEVREIQDKLRSKLAINPSLQQGQ